MKNFIENMVEKLNKLNIYNIKENSQIYNELLVYDSALNYIKNIYDDLIKEITITTSENYGIYMRERLWGVIRTDLSIEERRENIIKRLALGAYGFTLRYMNDFLKSLGISAEITEVPEKSRAYIYVNNGKDITLNMRKYLNKQIMEYFPAHNEVFVDYREGNWDTLEIKKTMFDTYDSFNFTWDQLENFE